MDFRGKDRPLVNNEERVARFVFEPSMFDDDILAPSAFELAPKLSSGKPETYLSVSRMNLFGEITPESYRYKPRVEGDRFCGYAHIATGTVHSFIQYDTRAFVLEWPTKDNPAHAGIAILTDSDFAIGGCHTPGYILLTAHLARQSSLVRFPSPSLPDRP